MKASFVTKLLYYESKMLRKPVYLFEKMDYNVYGLIRLHGKPTTSEP